MKEKILLFFKGMILGLAMIIPGVSGGTLAISLGIYERIIKAISHFFKDFKENIKFILTLGLGVIFSLAICSVILSYTFEHYPIPTVLFFIGLIVGSIPLLLNKADYKKTINPVNIFLALLGAGILIGISFLKGDNQNVVLATSFLGIIELIIVGFIASATMVIPGISGSFVLMTIGYYEPIISTVSELVKMQNVVHNLFVLIPFGIGVVFGIIIIAKLIEYFLKNHKIKTYYVILGFLMASILDIVLRLFSYSGNIIQIIIGIVLFIISAFLSLKVFKD